MGAYWRIVRSFSRSIRWFMLGWSLLSFAYFGVQGVLLNLYLVRLGFTPAFIGLLLGSGQLIWALFALPAAAIGRNRGPRWALIAGGGLSGLSMALFLLADSLPMALRSVWLIGTWLPVWLGVALVTVNATPFLMAAARPAERNHAFGVQQATIGLFGFLGSLVAGFLPQLLAEWMALGVDSAASFRMALWLVPIADILAAVVFSRMRPATRSVKIEGRGFVADEEQDLTRNEDNRGIEATQDATVPLGLFVLFGIVVFCTSIGEGAARTFFNVYMDTDMRVSSSQIGAIMGFGQLLPAGIALFAPLMIARWGTRRTIGLAAMGVVLCLLLLAFVPHWAVASIGFLGVLAMVSIGSPARNMFSQEIVLARWRTTTSAIVTIGLALGWAFTAVVGGYVINTYGFSTLFLAGMIPSLLAVVLLMGLSRLWPMVTVE